MESSEILNSELSIYYKMKGFFIMKNYEIKTEGNFSQFEEGAIRYTKDGKGRFDLIPVEVVSEIISKAYNECKLSVDGTWKTSKSHILETAYSENECRYVNTIIDIVCYEYAIEKKTDMIHGEPVIYVTFPWFEHAFCKMLKELAIHYEKGAEKYGVDNWKKGIPIAGGERGGSFTDSGLRHLNQWLLGDNDEPHHIACIWNFFGAIYCQKHVNETQNIFNGVKGEMIASLYLSTFPDEPDKEESQYKKDDGVVTNSEKIDEKPERISNTKKLAENNKKEYSNDPSDLFDRISDLICYRHIIPFKNTSVVETNAIKDRIILYNINNISTKIYVHQNYRNENSRDLIRILYIHKGYSMGVITISNKDKTVNILREFYTGKPYDIRSYVLFQGLKEDLKKLF